VHQQIGPLVGLPSGELFDSLLKLKKLLAGIAGRLSMDDKYKYVQRPRTVAKVAVANSDAISS